MRTTPPSTDDFHFDAIVGTSRSADADHVYPTLGAAIAHAPADANRSYRILIGRGEWRERVVIDRPNVHLVGEDVEQSVLVFSRHAGIPGPDGRPIGTFDTATVRVTAPGFRAENLTIANDYDYVGDMQATGEDSKVGHHAGQAVALAIEGAADRTLLDGVTLIGHQDTLYAHAGRSLFRGCSISGSVDFIFGGGRVVFDACDIVSRHRPGEAVQGFISAPNTDIHQSVGFVFNRCRLAKESGIRPESVALGRPWRQTTHFADGFYGNPDHVGASTYLWCWMDDHIAPEGWHPMDYNAKGGERATLRPEEARFFEYGSTGPGAGSPSAHRRVLSEAEAEALTIATVLDGWQG